MGRRARRTCGADATGESARTGTDLEDRKAIGPTSSLPL